MANRGSFAPSAFQVGDAGASFAQPLTLIEATCSGTLSSSDLLLSGGLKINDLDTMSLDGSNNCVLHRPCLFPSGFTSAGVCGFQNTVVMNDVQMSSLTTPSVNLQMPGLATQIKEETHLECHVRKQRPRSMDMSQ